MLPDSSVRGQVDNAIPWLPWAFSKKREAGVDQERLITLRGNHPAPDAWSAKAVAGSWRWD